MLVPLFAGTPPRQTADWFNTPGKHMHTTPHLGTHTHQKGIPAPHFSAAYCTDSSSRDIQSPSYSLLSFNLLECEMCFFFFSRHEV